MKSSSKRLATLKSSAKPSSTVSPLFRCSSFSSKPAFFMSEIATAIFPLSAISSSVVLMICSDAFANGLSGESKASSVFSPETERVLFLFLCKSFFSVLFSCSSCFCFCASLFSSLMRVPLYSIMMTCLYTVFSPSSFVFVSSS
uniref:Serine/threonine-protein phosphatase n=1 Tax=Parascaris univalens TaxID=6257 RepID=A0A915AXH8_PARUN